MADTLSFDPDVLSRRYAQERDKRLRSDGNAQYVDVRRNFSRYLDDPYADPNFTRDPQRRTLDVLIIGGGFGGLLAGARLRAAGFDDLCVLDQAADFGGTWYWNRYPGAACDTESYIYMPLLEETGYVPTERYAKAPELRAHAQRIGRHYDLYRGALLQTRVSEMRWLESEQRWRIDTDRDDVLLARHVVLAGGPLSLPKLPGIAGIERFKGHSFHTSRWDYDYTGGEDGGPLDKLADKRVGLIGTGATAVQCVPHVGATAKSFQVFQRTPSSVDVRDNRPTDSAWANALQPGWQRERMDNFTAVISGAPFDVDLVNDGWTDLIGNILLAARRRREAGEDVDDEMALIQLADYQKMERVRARIDATVVDRATADALKPWYNQFCKRPCFHDEYLQTFNRPNVQLIDTDGRGVEQITERGVVVAGREYPLDCLIYGTGFEVGTCFSHRLGFDVVGRGGQTLAAKWQDGASTLHGLFTHGFPNLFVMTTQQSGQSANFVHMLDEQSHHIAYVLSQARERGAVTVEADAEAEAAWVDTIVKLARGRRDFLLACTPGYYNNEGSPDSRTERNSQYWRGPMSFIRMWRRWRADGNLAGLTLSAAPVDA